MPKSPNQDFAARCLEALQTARKKVRRALTSDEWLATVRKIYEADALERKRPMISTAAEGKLRARGAAKAASPQTAKAIDEAWLQSLEAHPANAGVDVRKELGKCQFWAENQKPPLAVSRRRFVNWLLKADRTVGIKGAGQSSYAPKPITAIPPDISKPLPGWPMVLRNHCDTLTSSEINAFCAVEWPQLPEWVRKLLWGVK